MIGAVGTIDSCRSSTRFWILSIASSSEVGGGVLQKGTPFVIAIIVGSKSKPASSA